MLCLVPRKFERKYKGKKYEGNVKGKKNWRKIKNEFKANKLFLYNTSNLSIHQFVLFDIKIK